ncbi:hypothetical protein [Hyphomonas sp.]|uniref:hypothetical protein n=1 Tax=Hyphomonas sp. TaxID=87 RepID=UPI00391BD963
MRLKLIAAAAALAITAAAPAAARYDDAASINAAYAQGKASGQTAETVNEHWTCATFWMVWADFVEDEFSEAMLAKFDPALSEASAEAAMAHWERQALLKMGTGMAPIPEETDAYIRGQINKAWDFAEGVAFGEDYTLPHVLGVCALPAPG